MFEPQNRALFIEALRPPAGYSLDCAIGTTYTLDLLALVTVPLGFTIFDWQDDSGRPEANPLALLEAVRRNAERMAIFCQEDRIAIPRQHKGLFGYIESSVIPVRPPEHGSFHPKVWALRFVGLGKEVLYRLLVLSRNLTFDRSWDTMLVLDGELTGRTYAFAANHPLGDFFKALPRMARVPLSQRVYQQVDQVEGELRRVRFQLPEGFDEAVFWPLGIKGHPPWPFKARIDRILVVSRFVSEGCLRRLAAQGKGNILVSDVDSLDVLGQSALDAFSRVLVFQDGVEPEPSEETDVAVAGSISEAGPEVAPEAPLSGLHAKAYIADSGWKARVWTGSANATDAAFTKNVEFMVELIGRKSRCGVDAVLGEGAERASLLSLLRDYERGEQLVKDPVMAELESMLDEARRQIAKAGLVARVSPADKPQEYLLALHLPDGPIPRLPDGIRGSCRPITLREPREWKSGARPASSDGSVAVFGPLSLEALSSFFAFELTASQAGQKLSAGFVLNLPLEGAPEDRSERILLSMLGDREQVRRYLFLLLAEAASSPGEVLDLFRALDGAGTDGGGVEAGLPLFEVMVKALHRSPDSLDRVARLIDDLKKTPEGRSLLPEGLEAVWEPIWEARKGLRHEAAP